MSIISFVSDCFQSFLPLNQSNGLWGEHTLNYYKVWEENPHKVTTSAVPWTGPEGWQVRVAGTCRPGKLSGLLSGDLPSHKASSQLCFHRPHNGDPRGKSEHLVTNEKLTPRPSFSVFFFFCCLKLFFI